jgi:dihydroflavonol-4-reductase
MKILVTGATGFIGKHLVKKLSVKNNIRCFIRKESSPQDISFLKNCGAEIFQGSLSDKNSLSRAMVGMDAVFHLAGGGYVATTFKKGYSELKKLNVDYTKNVLEAAAKKKVKKFVLFSSISAMGIIVNQNLNEETSCKPQTPHEVCKFESENLACQYKNKMLITIIRPGIVYGPFGINSEVLQLSRMLKRHLFIIPGNGKNLMPWVHVDDVVNASVLAFEKNRKSCGVFIIVSDPQPTFNQFINSIRKELGVSVLIIHIPAFIFRLAGLILEKAGDLLGFAPPVNSIRARSMTSDRIYNVQKIKHIGHRQKSNLNENMKKTIKWYRENGLI